MFLQNLFPAFEGFPRHPHIKLHDTEYATQTLSLRVLQHQMTCRSVARSLKIIKRSIVQSGIQTSKLGNILNPKFLSTWGCTNFLD